MLGVNPKRECGRVKFTVPFEEFAQYTVQGVHFKEIFRDCEGVGVTFLKVQGERFGYNVYGVDGFR